MKNTKDKWYLTATIHNPYRLDLWKDIFPGGIVPIVSAFPTRAELPGISNALVYMLDMDAITDDQRARLIETMSQRFKMPCDEVERLLDQGVPILEQDVIVTAYDLGRYII